MGCEKRGNTRLNSPVFSLLDEWKVGLFAEMWQTAGRSGLGGEGTEARSLRSKWGLSRRMFYSSN